MQARFGLNDAVVLRTNMEIGRVVGAPALDGGEYWYRVQFIHRVENVVEEDLDACLASTILPGQRQLFFPIGDNYSQRSLPL